MKHKSTLNAKTLNSTTSNPLILREKESWQSPATTRAVHFHFDLNPGTTTQPNYTELNLKATNRVTRRTATRTPFSQRGSHPQIPNPTQTVRLNPRPSRPSLMQSNNQNTKTKCKQCQKTATWKAHLEQQTVDFAMQAGQLNPKP